jgi:RNA polymerase sigma-70 factor, ECF subfamily
LRAWLFTIARRRLIDHRRRSARRRTSPTPTERLAERAGAADPAEMVVESLSGQAAIDLLVADLSANEAEVVLLRVVGGLDASEVARILHRTPGWVRVTQHRALRRLARGAFADRAVTRDAQ